MYSNVPLYVRVSRPKAVRFQPFVKLFGLQFVRTGCTTVIIDEAMTMVAIKVSFTQTQISIIFMRA